MLIESDMGAVHGWLTEPSDCEGAKALSSALLWATTRCAGFDARFHDVTPFFAIFGFGGSTIYRHLPSVLT